MSIQIRFEVEFEKDFEQSIKNLGHILAKEYYRMLTENILKNKFGFQNKPSTLKSKKGSRPLIDTGEYIKSIKVEGNKIFLKDGVHKSGIMFSELGDLLEYGRRDRGFKGFPVWRLTTKQFKEAMRKNKKLMSTSFVVNNKK